MEPRRLEAAQRDEKRGDKESVEENRIRSVSKIRKESVNSDVITMEGQGMMEIITASNSSFTQQRAKARRLLILN